MQFKLEATGTYWIFHFFEEVDLGVLQAEIEEIINQFDLVFSRFNSDSQLYELNQNKVLENPDKELVQAINLGLKMQEITGGVFTPFIGGELVKRGYGRNSPLVEEYPAEAGGGVFSFYESQETTPSTYGCHPFKEGEFPNKIHSLTNYPNKGNFIALQPNQILDLGSFAKGLLIDKLAKFIKSKGVKYFLINGGGDILVTSNQEKPVKIFLEDPLTQKPTKAVKVKNIAICSSSNQKRIWKQNGVKHSHIINGKNQSKQINGTTVFHPSATISDLLATTLFLNGEEFIEELKTKFGKFKFNIF